MWQTGLSINFVLNSLAVIFAVVYWYLAFVLNTDSVTVPIPDEAKTKVLISRIISFIYSFIIAAWSARFVSPSSKVGILIKFGVFAYGVAMGILFYSATTLCPNNMFCRKVVIAIQPLLGSLAIVTSVSFSGVLGWLTEKKFFKG